MALDITDHPLFDVAIEQAVKLTPPSLNPRTAFSIQEVQNLMAMMWVQGVIWGVMNPQAAVSSMLNFDQERKADAAANKDG